MILILAGLAIWALATLAAYALVYPRLPEPIDNDDGVS